MGDQLNALGPTRAGCKIGQRFLDAHASDQTAHTFKSKAFSFPVRVKSLQAERAKCCGSEIPISADEWLFVPQRYHCCLDYRQSIYSLLKSPEVRRYQGRTGYVLPRTGYVLHQSISHSVKRGLATRTESMGGRTIGRSQFSQNGRRHSSL